MNSWDLSGHDFNAIIRLQAELNQFPKHFWLFAVDDGLAVMRYKEDGSRALTADGGMDPDYLVTTLYGPEIDGGDW